MLVVVIRTLILYASVTAAVRIMGKRQIGEMQPSELVVAIMISDLASVPMQAVDIPLLSGIIPVFTLIVAEVFAAFLSLKSKAIRRIIAGEPSVVIRGGRIDEKELVRQRFNLNDLLEQLRISGYPDISQVEIAVLETNGQLSIIPKAEARNVTVKDLNLKNAEKETIPFMLISDGKINKAELERSGKSEKWLNQELKKKKIPSVKDVFVASLDEDGKLFLQKKERGSK